MSLRRPVITAVLRMGSLYYLHLSMFVFLLCLCIVSANFNDVTLISIPALGIFHKYTNCNDSATMLWPSSGYN